MVVSIQQPSSKAQFWKLVRSLLVLLVVLSAVNQIMEDRGLGGRAGMSHQEVKPESQAQMRTFADVQVGSFPTPPCVEWVCLLLMMLSSSRHAGGG